MLFKRDQNFKLVFGLGVFVHLVLVWTRAQFSELTCVNNDCSDLILFDMPISVIYFALPAIGQILFSLTIGSVLWGFYFHFIYRILLNNFAPKTKRRY